jgi:hypothetical protein
MTENRTSHPLTTHGPLTTSIDATHHLHPLIFPLYFFSMFRPHTDLEKQHRPPPSHSQNDSCTCHHLHIHHHPNQLHRFGKMSEEILFDRSMIDRFGHGGYARRFVGEGNERFGNDRHDRREDDRGGNGLNPRARSFFVCPLSP